MAPTKEQQAEVVRLLNKDMKDTEVFSRIVRDMLASNLDEGTQVLIVMNLTFNNSEVLATQAFRDFAIARQAWTLT